jgi:Domain of unknown function (DUF6754)
VILLLVLLGLSPATDVRARDQANDAGGNIVVSWQLSPDDAVIDEYQIFRTTLPDTVFQKIGFSKSGIRTFLDNTVDDARQYRYRMICVKGEERAASDPSAVVRSSPQFFHAGRVNILVSILLFTGLVILFVGQARRGANLFIRRISGLAAVDEAIGRATEMGRPILYVPGLGDIDYTATIASMNILGEVAKKIAEYDTPLVVPNRWSVTYNVSKEVVREAFASEGRPDKFRDEYVRYLTEDQFGFAAAVDGIILREKPATNFFIGTFWAESLILAETGAQSGAIQIAGTDAVNQLPFFVTACDYTLMGEELYAASAYLSREPLLLGALKAQDFGKLIVLGLLLAITALSFFNINLLSLLRTQ